MNIEINQNLKKLRQEKGNTLENLADYLNISFQAISKWERGECYPDVTLLPKIAAYYKVSVDDLLGVGEREIRQNDQQNEKVNLKQIMALMVVALGAERVAKIYKHLKDDEIKSITLEIVNLGSLKESTNETLANFISFIFSV